MIFNTKEWADIIKETYNFKPICYSDETGAMQVFYVNSLFNRKVTSHPFNTCVELQSTNPINLIQDIINDGKTMNVDYIELKFSSRLDKDIVNKLGLIEKQYYSHYIVDLNNINYSKKFAKNLRYLHNKAVKENITIEEMKDDELKEVYELMLYTAHKKHDSISQPYVFFKNMYDKLKPNNIKIFVSKQNNKIIACMFLLLIKDKCHYGWGSQAVGYEKYSVLTMLIDNSINYCKNNNYNTFNFGITSDQHEGLTDYKEKWGTTQVLIYHYYKSINKEIKVTDYYTSHKTVKKFIKYIPHIIIQHIPMFVYRWLA